MYGLSYTHIISPTVQYPKSAKIKGGGEFTPLKTNMTMENPPFKDVFPILQNTIKDWYFPVSSKGVKGRKLFWVWGISSSKAEKVSPKAASPP